MRQLDWEGSLTKITMIYRMFMFTSESPGGRFARRVHLSDKLETTADDGRNVRLEQRTFTSRSSGQSIRIFVYFE